MTTVQIELPEELARKAKEAGLLTPEALEQLIAEALYTSPALLGELARVLRRPKFSARVRALSASNPEGVGAWRLSGARGSTIMDSSFSRVELP